MDQTRSDRFFYDYVDPLSYLVEIELRSAEERLGFQVARIPFEVRPPPEPLLDPGAEDWLARWEDARRRGEPSGIGLKPLRLVPWTRKAHELVLYAGEHGLATPAHDRLFQRVLCDGADIGRIDVLVELAVELGLDRTETKAVLDVDRHTAAVVQARREAIGSGVHAPPTLTRAASTLEGFHNAAEIVKFFRSQ